MSAAEDFEEFVCIVEAGSLTAAAERLNIPRPTLSRRLQRLEARLKTRLLHRTTRRLTLTAAGSTLYERARQVVASAREAEAAVLRLDNVPRGLVRATIPSNMFPDMISAWFTEFLERYPEVQLEVIATSKHVDLVADHVDLAVRAGPVTDPSLISRTIVRFDLIAVAGPGYLATRGRPQTVDELADHNCIVGFHEGTTPETHWPTPGGSTVAVSGRFATNQMDVRMGAAKRDLGIALVSSRIAGPLIEAGELVHLLPGEVGRPVKLQLVVAERTYQEPKVTALSNFLHEKFQTVIASRS